MCDSVSERKGSFDYNTINSKHWFVNYFTNIDISTLGIIPNC